MSARAAWELIPLAERARWEAACARVPARDVFYRHAYAQLCHDAGDGDPFLFAYEDGAGGRLVYAFVRRPLEGLPFFARAGLEGPAYDLITPNRGYGGPLGAGDDAALLRGFRAAFDAYCQQAHVVTEFVRFHPVLGNQRLLAGALDVVYDRETVLVDLQGGADALLQRLHPGHRRNVRKAQGAGLGFRMLAGAAAAPLLPAFHRLYEATMDKVHAAAASYFPLEYMAGLFRRFGEDALLGAVLLGGELVSGAVYLREGGLLHYQLGGSSQAHLRLGSNVLQFHEAARWGAAQGCTGLHLGGGHVGRDALFTFKHRFDPGGVRGFYVGRKVHQPQVYARLAEAWARHHGQPPPAHYFPAYRASPPPTPAAPSHQVPGPEAAAHGAPA